MALTTWLAFCFTAAVACMTPGPAVLFVIAATLARGGVAGMAAVGGILVANALWILLSATGIAAVVVTSPAIFEALTWAGAAYLVFLGVRMLLPAPAAAALPIASRDSRTFLRALVVQGTNPNAPAFFLALLPQFVDQTGAVDRQLVVLGATALVVELVVLGLYVQLGVRARDLLQGRIRRALECAGGVLLIAAAARLALARWS